MSSTADEKRKQLAELFDKQVWTWQDAFRRYFGQGPIKFYSEGILDQALEVAVREDKRRKAQDMMNKLLRKESK